MSTYGTHQAGVAPGSTAQSYNPYQGGHYPTQYQPTQPPITQPPPQQYFPPTFQAQPKSSPPPDLPPSPPDLSSVTPDVASQTIKRLISSELREVGFSAVQPLALQRLELEVVAFVEQLYRHAHEYANLSNRAGPIATDLMLACEEHDIEPKAMRRMRTKNANKRKRNSVEVEAPTLIPPPSRTPSPELLPSDDEGTPPIIPVTLRSLPSYFPNLPPKHTYLRTPVSPPKKAALPSLEKKLKTAGLVQESLKNLLLATEDSSGQEDGELLGHIVNWEAGVHPRKRWRLGS